MNKIIDILLVEDNEGDIFLTKEAFEDGKIRNNISVVRDGVEAIDFLNKVNRYENASTPDIVLMDLNLPKKNGQEVLKYIRENDKLNKLPVIMLTTSSSENDKQESYKNSATFYLTKPFETCTFLEAISKIETFHISIEKSIPKPPDDKK
ncbi:MAG: response regulator [Bacteroidota bacterium]|nr:response regulator [Bacteroidota bacterium]